VRAITATLEELQGRATSQSRNRLLETGVVDFFENMPDAAQQDLFSQSSG